MTNHAEALATRLAAILEEMDRCQGYCGSEQYDDAHAALTAYRAAQAVVGQGEQVFYPPTQHHADAKPGPKLRWDADRNRWIPEAAQAEPQEVHATELDPNPEQWPVEVMPSELARGKLAASILEGLGWEYFGECPEHGITACWRHPSPAPQALTVRGLTEEEIRDGIARVGGIHLYDEVVRWAFAECAKRCGYTVDGQP